MSEEAVSTPTEKKKTPIGVLILWITLFLVSGTCSLIFGKLLYQTPSIGRYGQTENFQKPWFSNFIMFFGMSFLFIGFEVRHLLCTSHQEQSRARCHRLRPIKSVYYKVFAPAFCDFLASFIMFVGLLWIDVSIWQMIRGSIIIFTGLIRQFWLKKPLKASEWVALGVIFLSLAVVGVAQLLTPKQQQTEPVPVGKMVLGMVLVFVAQGIQALQTVIEEHLLQGIEAPANMVVGMEGVWGFVLTAFVALPIAYFLPGEEGSGLHEDFIDSLYLCKNSMTVLTLNILSVVVLLVFNLSSMRVTLYTNSVVRNLLEPFRTFLVWATAVFIHYFIDKKYGEGLTVYSWLQLAGFVILSIGMLMFNGTIKCGKEKKEEVKESLV
ncbi:hypothetical protein BLSTO_05593 [Blastocystis sp. subtype 1]